MMQEAIEHGRGERLVVREGAGPLCERQIARENHAATLVTLGNDVEEQIRFLASEWQITDFVHNQQPWTDHGTIEYFLSRPCARAVASCSIRSAAVMNRVFMPAMAARYVIPIAT